MAVTQTHTDLRATVASLYTSTRTRILSTRHDDEQSRDRNGDVMITFTVHTLGFNELSGLLRNVVYLLRF